MADMEYKCPACGGALAFDSASQKLKCPYCESEYELSQFEGSEANSPGSEEGFDFEANGADKVEWEVEPGKEWGDGEAGSLEVYSCSSCGGEIVCDDTTTSTSCPYCGNPVVLKGKLSGMLKPDFVIPFKLDKKAAKDALRKHVESKKLVPKLFRSENHIDEIKGVYIPFWLFDADVEANIRYTGEKIRAWSDSTYDYTEISYYDIFRQGNVSFAHVPVDGSEKMPDDLMESIEPFKFDEAVEFNKAYLAGYMADKYDIDADASITAANSRIKKSTEQAFKDTVVGYSSVTPVNSHMNLQNGKAKYALYPVWLLNTRWQDNTYTFAMNGQTGKFVGDLPIDKGAYRRKLALFAGIFTVVGTVFSAIVDYLFL